MSMEWLNYLHLTHFHAVVREGGVAAAGKSLGVSASTISEQLQQLELRLDAELLDRSGRRLVPTELGWSVYRYAEEIVALGEELLDTVRQRGPGRQTRLLVGLADIVPKLVARNLIRPALQIEEDVRLVLRVDEPDRLLADLALHRLHVVIADAPIERDTAIRAHHHVLGEYELGVYGTAAFARQYRKGFPASLATAPMLLPSPATSLRRTIDAWFRREGIAPTIAGEFDDSSLINEFGATGTGLFVAPTAIEADLARMFRVRPIGLLAEAMETYYAITMQRRVQHPAVAAILGA